MLVQAGANSVGHLLTSRNLHEKEVKLHGAILQSGGPTSPLLTIPMEEAESRTGVVIKSCVGQKMHSYHISISINLAITSIAASLAAALGCSGENPAACLRERTHQQIVDVQDQVIIDVQIVDVQDQVIIDVLDQVELIVMCCLLATVGIIILSFQKAGEFKRC